MASELSGEAFELDGITDNAMDTPQLSASGDSDDSSTLTICQPKEYHEFDRNEMLLDFERVKVWSLANKVQQLESQLESSRKEKNVLLVKIEELKHKEETADESTSRVKNECDMLVAKIVEENAEPGKLKASLNNCKDLQAEVEKQKSEIKTLRADNERKRSQNVKLLGNIYELRASNANKRSANNKDEIANTGLGFKSNGVDLQVNILQRKPDTRGSPEDQRPDKEKVENAEHMVSEFAKANEALEYENKNLRSELSVLRSRFSQELGDANRLVNSQLQTSKETNDKHSSMFQDNAKLKQCNTTLEKENSILRRENEKKKTALANAKEDREAAMYKIAFYITQLDLANARYRVYTCEHEDITKIPDRKNTTQIKTTVDVTDDFLQNFDPTFMIEYRKWRQHVIDHHRAHERAHQGRGRSSQNLMRLFTSLDQKRVTPITYT